MKLVLLVCKPDSALANIKGFIPEDFTVLETGMDSKGVQLLRSIVAGVVLVDTDAPGVRSWLEDAYRWRPDLTYVGATSEPDPNHFLSRYFYDLLPSPFTAWQVNSLLSRSWERVELLLQVNSLKKKVNASAGQVLAASPTLPNRLTAPSGLRERVLCDLSRVFANNFDQEKLLGLFINAVTELIPVGKVSILLLDEKSGCYQIAAQRGLDPAFCSGLRFGSSRGLIAWLAAAGRLLRVDEVADAVGLSAEVLQELQLLQAVVSVPLLVHGQLIGVLNLGPKVTGAPFYEEELEILYVLSSNTAMALRDIQLHHQLRYQKMFTENILQRMNSGVVAINGDDSIITFNARAAEILGLRRDEVIGQDLRCLPSPLGDMLYAARITGQPVDREEIELARGRIPLEVSTYQLANEEQVLGSVMIFDDISERRRFEQERRQAAQLDVLHRFVGQLAHEVKNPMVAIQTFSELLPEKYNDSSFREFFTHTVRQEIKRLNELVEQLIAYSSPLSYQYTVVEIHELLDMGLSLLQEWGRGTETFVETKYHEERLYVRADKTLLARAFSYLADSFAAVETGGRLYITTVYDDALFGQGGVTVGLSDSKTKIKSEDLNKLFDPLFARQESYISLKLPVSRKIIEDHAGRVEASINKEKQLVFQVHLPVFPGERGEYVDATRENIGG